LVSSDNGVPLPFYEPNSVVEQTRMKQRAQSYHIVDNDLYKISVSGPCFAVSAKKKVRSMRRSYWS
jgi:hypothetical protein